MKNPNRKDYPPTDNGTIDFAIAVIDSLRDENIKLKSLLTELYTMVKGECPRLLDDDSTTCAKLDMEIEESLK